MNPLSLSVSGIPALLWGAPSKKVYLFVHGKMSCKESAGEFAEIAAEHGWQTLSFVMHALHPMKLTVKRESKS